MAQARRVPVCLVLPLDPFAELLDLTPDLVPDLMEEIR